jgi:ribonuclease P protein component
LSASAVTVTVHAWQRLPDAGLLPGVAPTDARSFPPEHGYSTGSNSQASAMDDRIAVNLERLKKRQDFLAVKKGARTHQNSFILQVRNRRVDRTSSRRATPTNNVARFGITVTKKVGNAVIRNRIRRRLREAIRLNASNIAHAGRDYVLIARKKALSTPFDTLTVELVNALAHTHPKKTLKNKRSSPISKPTVLNNGAKNLESGKPNNKPATLTGFEFDGK